ncbi:MAG TPA: cytochrome C oxidase subunit IV family protein [bacterium]|jgi:caa(3)-type oxidase subunit IV|nr:cytochrome C oxidase subunit IV family protein [bacterium]
MSVSASKSNHELVYVALVILALVTVGASFLHLPGNENVYLIFGLALVQALLVAIQYMGLKLEGVMVYGLVIIPLILFAILVFLCIPDISHYPLNLKL